jgi:murein DD-endopeptidase MepM/ murein hydrolase activator NlpD
VVSVRVATLAHFLVRRLLATTLTIFSLPAAAQAEWRTLDRGDRGDDVKLVQRALTEVGIRTRADGVYGSKTARNVKRYERREDIPVDGRVSKGQARGLLRRAEMDPAAVDAETETRATPRAVANTSGSFPVQGKWEWGRGMSGGHDGVDVLAECGTAMITPEGGKVIRVDSQGSAGNYLIVRSPSGEDHVFMHLQEPSPVTKGADLAPGTSIGAVGQTGNASTCHLHFEIWTAPGWYEGGAPRDPKPDLERYAAS